MTPETASLRRENSRRLLAHTLDWQPRRAGLPRWLECTLGVLAWCGQKAYNALRVGEPRRKFRTCAMPRCKRVFYGVSELCRECRITVRDRPR